MALNNLDFEARRIRARQIQRKAENRRALWMTASLVVGITLMVLLFVWAVSV